MPELQRDFHIKASPLLTLPNIGAAVFAVLTLLSSFAPESVKSGFFEEWFKVLDYFPISCYLLLILALLGWGQRVMISELWQANPWKLRVPILVVVLFFIGALFGWDIKPAPKTTQKKPQLDEPWESEKQVLTYIKWKVTDGSMDDIPGIDLRTKLRDAVRSGLRAKYIYTYVNHDTVPAISEYRQQFITEEINDSVFELYMYDGSTLNPDHWNVDSRYYLTKDVWKWSW